MSFEKIKKDKLRDWVNVYKKSIAEIPHETTNCLISLEEIRFLITYIDHQNSLKGAKIDGVRIYFTRRITNYPSPGSLQNSIAIVPTINYSPEYTKPDKGGAANYYEKDTITCLCPGGDAHENTGLCPPNCGGEHI
jgi:hypothetical protein